MSGEKDGAYVGNYQLNSGVNISLHVDGSTGRWYAYQKSVRLASGKDRESVIRNASRTFRQKKTRVAIPASYLHHEGRWSDRYIVDPITITGIDGRTAKVRFRNERTKQSDTLDGYHDQDETVLKRLTKTQAAKLLRLKKRVEESDDVYGKFRHSLQLDGDLVGLVQAAIEKEGTDG